MARIFSLCLLFCACLLPLSGCNTVSGFGQDMSAAGHKITGASH